MRLRRQLFYGRSVVVKWSLSGITNRLSRIMLLEQSDITIKQRRRPKSLLVLGQFQFCKGLPNPFHMRILIELMNLFVIHMSQKSNFFESLNTSFDAIQTVR